LALTIVLFILVAVLSWFNNQSGITAAATALLTLMTFLLLIAALLATLMVILNDTCSAFEDVLVKSAGVGSTRWAVCNILRNVPYTLGCV
jgi:hypothetical protein